jgi:hypothetical protein
VVQNGKVGVNMTLLRAVANPDAIDPRFGSGIAAAKTRLLRYGAAEISARAKARD